MKLRLFPKLLPAVLACAAGFSHAQTDTLVRDAQAALSQGQAQQAYALLEPHEVRRAGEPEFDLALGMAANAAGQFSRAILALERVLAVDPNNTQARAELGRALYGVGDTRAARALLSESKLQGIPAVAGESIDQLLWAVDRVDAAGRSSYKGYAEFGLGHDSNVNSGPSERNVVVPAFGGSLVTLNPGSTRMSGSYAQLGAGFSGRIVLEPRWSIVANLTGSTRAHNGAADASDMLQVDANAGVSYRVERHEFIVAAQVGSYDLDHARVRNIQGLVADWTFRFDGFRQFTAYAQLTRMEYPQQSVADVDRHVLGITYAHLMRSGTLFYGGLYAGEEDERAAAVPHLGHRLAGARGGVQHPLSPHLAVFTTLAYEQRRFGGTDPFFLVARRDRQTQVSLGLSWVPAPDWRVTPQVAWAQTDSNVPTANYEKSVVSVTVRRDF